MDDILGARPWCDFQPGKRDKTWVLPGTLSNDSDKLRGSSRGIQGIAMPVVALIKAMEVAPNKWTKEIVDDVVREGDGYYNWCISPEDVDKFELSLRNLNKHLYVKNRRVTINIHSSLIIGDIKATSDTQLPNLSKGIPQFFDIHQFGIVQVKDLAVAIWTFAETEELKGKKAKDNVQETSYYYYDSNARNKIG